MVVAAPSPIILDTERLSLYIPGPEAAERVVRYFETNRAHLTPWEPPFPTGMFTPVFWRKRLVIHQQEYREGRTMRLAMVPKKQLNADLLGFCNFTQFVRGAFCACTLGYSLAEQAQGQGYMTEALRAAIAHMFQELGFHRVMANYIPTNERSGKLLRRLGFVVEGYARDYLFINGSWRDHILTSLTNPKAPLPAYLSTQATG